MALFGWPLVCIAFFVRFPVDKAAIWSLLGGYLLLPSGLSVDAHILPPLDKFSVTAMTTFVLCWMKGIDTPSPRTPWLTHLFCFIFVITPIFTTLHNSYELHMGDRSIPGFYPLDGLKMAGHNVVELLPFFVGIRFLSSERSRDLLLRSLPIATLFYSLPMLFELRMSPQVQRLVYGVSNSGFITLVRAGGYRPMVFLSNGLELALFTAMALIAAVVAVRARLRLLRMPASVVAAYLAGLLLLCKTLGAALYGMVVAPLVLLTKPRTWVRVCFLVTLIICFYPMLRNYDLIPVRRVAAAASSVSTERGGSFLYRVQNEDRLLAKANQKPFFGWGTWGRNRVYDQQTGTDESITDGAWILRYGMYGWIGYLSLFGLFATAVFGALRGVRGPVTSSSVVLGGLSLLLAVNLIDLIPNASLVPLTYLIAGSIATGVPVRALSRFKTVQRRQAAVREPVPAS